MGAHGGEQLSRCDEKKVFHPGRRTYVLRNAEGAQELRPHGLSLDDDVVQLAQPRRDQELGIRERQKRARRVRIGERERIALHHQFVMTGEHHCLRIRVELPLCTRGSLRESFHEDIAATERPVGFLLGNATREKRGSRDAHDQ